MTAEEITNELIKDFKDITFGIDYKFDISKEDQIKILRYCLHFCNQMVVNCTKEYRNLYIEAIQILNLKLNELKK